MYWNCSHNNCILSLWYFWGKKILKACKGIISYPKKIRKKNKVVIYLYEFVMCSKKEKKIAVTLIWLFIGGEKYCLVEEFGWWETEMGVEQWDLQESDVHHCGRCPPFFGIHGLCWYVCVLIYMYCIWHCYVDGNASNQKLLVVRFHHCKNCHFSVLCCIL